MHIEVTTPAEAVQMAIEICKNYGDKINPRGINTREINNVSMLISNPWQIPFELKGRNLRPFIGAVECLQLVGMVSMPELVVAGSRPFARFLDSGIFHGAYGPRIYGKLDPLIKLLKEDPYSRQAILTIYSSEKDLNSGMKDIPCTLSLQFFIRNNELCLRTSMRSNDVWLGLPYDLVQFCGLQGAVAKALDLPMGWYSHNVGSMHLYESDLEATEKLELTAIEQKEYKPLWSGETIEEISVAARLILNSQIDEESGTEFEKWLISAL